MKEYNYSDHLHSPYQVPALCINTIGTNSPYEGVLLFYKWGDKAQSHLDNLWQIQDLSLSHLDSEFKFFPHGHTALCVKYRKKNYFRQGGEGKSVRRSDIPAEI